MLNYQRVKLQDFVGELLTHHDPSPFHPNGQHKKSGSQTSRFPSGLLSGQTSLAGKFPTFPFQSSGLMVNWKWIINRHADLHGAVLVTPQHRDADLRIHQPWLGNPRTKWTVFHGFSWIFIIYKCGLLQCSARFDCQRVWTMNNGLQVGVHNLQQPREIAGYSVHLSLGGRMRKVLNVCKWDISPIVHVLHIRSLIGGWPSIN